MQIRPDGSPLYSPSDLVSFLEGDFAAWMERRHAEARARGEGAAGTFKPDQTDEEMALVARKGHEHEAVVLKRFRDRYPDCVEIAQGDEAEEQTRRAMREGCPLIYQGYLRDDGWQGYPDFLVRVDEPSALGAFSYRPLDSKLARSVRPYFLIQLCAYADLLERAQGVVPATLGFVLGDHAETEFETERYRYFYRHLRDVFTRFQQNLPDAMPDPALESGFGRWEEAAKDELRRRDDLRLIARITRSQIKRLRDGGLRTVAELVASIGPVLRVNADVLARLRRQARLQVASRGKPLPVYEVLPHDTGLSAGLATLPPESSGDVYFDLEGFPLAENGLEYLFGAVTVKNSAPEFHDWWAHDEAEERVAFEKAVDFLYTRWRDDPGMHVYHYAAYEVNALRKLMGKYATREDEIDALLRGDVFVDLYTVTRAGVAIGSEGYSLKDIEKLFSPARTAAVKDADSSVVEYQRWMDSGEPGRWRDSPILSAIRDYNREDCESTWRLALWLRARQAESAVAYVPPLVEAPDEPREARPEDLLAQELLGNAERETDAEARRVTQLVAWLLGFHRREEKPTWWRYFDRLGASEEDLFHDAECLAGVVRTERPPAKVKRSQQVEYRFDLDQDTKLSRGSNVHVLTGGGEPGKNEIIEFDADRGLLEMKFGPSKAIPDRCNLIPDELVSAAPLRAAIQRFAEAWRPGGDHPYRAVEDLLHRRAPRLRGNTTGRLLGETPQLPLDLISLVRKLDDTTLCIQGPPGSGKTYNAAQVIVALAGDGARIGITSNSHKAIVNLLAEVVKVWRLPRQGFRIFKATSDAEEAKELAHLLIQTCDTNAAASVLEPAGTILGGTAWVFAREQLHQRLDYLFVDEAGQVSLANAVAMGLSAKNIVLIGDQMQLAQPVQGSHPGQSGMSCLHYLLEGHATVPPDRGVLLAETWRLHPDICQFISDTAYDSRLKPRAHTARRCVLPPPGATRLSRGTGIVVDEIEHEGNTHSSDEEVTRITQIVADLERCRVIDDEGQRAFRREEDLLIVAPYNAQVRCLRERLGDGYRIGSVDKFQGQEASVVIVSMCASSLDDTPRGAGFLLSASRLNVAISRAKCLAVVVASKGLLRTRPNSVKEMELMNLYCRLRYHANVNRGSSVQ